MGFAIPPLYIMRILNPTDKLFCFKERITISYADDWFPTTSQKHSANNKIGISGGMGFGLKKYALKIKATP